MRHQIPRVSRICFAAALVVSCGVMSCKSRTFGDTARVKAASAAKVAFLPPITANPKLLTNLKIPSRESDQKPQDDLYVILPKKGSTSSEYSTILEASGKLRGLVPTVSNFATGAWSVTQYEKRLRDAKATDSTRSAPDFFAGDAVLAILKKNRATFSQIQPGGVNIIPSALGAASTIAPEVPTDQYTIADPSRPFSQTLCKGYDPREYSDIKWHYYCSIPALFRGCQRLLAGKHFSRFEGAIAKSYVDGSLSAAEYALRAATLRIEDADFVRSYCLGKTSGLASDVVDAFDNELHPIETGSFMKAGDLQKYFQKFYETQVDPTTGANMFDYIMRSGVYAFGYEQQQAVLNAYYGEMKPNDGHPFDPGNPDDCKKYREPRQFSENAASNPGTHCLAETPREIPY